MAGLGRINLIVSTSVYTSSLAYTETKTVYPLMAGLASINLIVSTSVYTSSLAKKENTILVFLFLWCFSFILALVLLFGLKRRDGIECMTPILLLYCIRCMTILCFAWGTLPSLSFRVLMMVSIGLHPAGFEPPAILYKRRTIFPSLVICTWCVLYIKVDWEQKNASLNFYYCRLCLAPVRPGQPAAGRREAPVLTVVFV